MPRSRRLEVRDPLTRAKIRAKPSRASRAVAMHTRVSSSPMRFSPASRAIMRESASVLAIYIVKLLFTRVKMMISMRLRNL